MKSNFFFYIRILYFLEKTLNTLLFFCDLIKRSNFLLKSVIWSTLVFFYFKGEGVKK